MNNNTDNFEQTNYVMDTSIQEAKWLLGSVAGLFVFVAGLGFTASIIGA